jgi:hypothetical protein
VQKTKITAQTDGSEFVSLLVSMHVFQTLERNTLILPAAVSLLAAGAGGVACLAKFIVKRFRNAGEEPDVFEVAKRLDGILFPSEN